MYEFPTIFETGELPKHWTVRRLVADGLAGWGLVKAGAKLPANFGKGMALIAREVGTATPEELSKLADKFLEEKRK